MHHSQCNKQSVFALQHCITYPVVYSGNAPVKNARLKYVSTIFKYVVRYTYIYCTNKARTYVTGAGKSCTLPVHGCTYVLFLYILMDADALNIVQNEVVIVCIY